jgi:hypothetical protein
MESLDQETIRVRVSFSGTRLEGPGFEELSRGQAPLVNILKARITLDGASFELTVTGQRSRIEEFFSQISRWGGSVSAFSLGTAPPEARPVFRQLPSLSIPRRFASLLGTIFE